jgi:hypothetical protein
MFRGDNPDERTNEVLGDQQRSAMDTEGSRVLGQTQTVLDLQARRPDGLIIFALFDINQYGDRTLTRGVHLDFQTWVDMGRPEQVTVTITSTVEPGDRLNG